MASIWCSAAVAVGVLAWGVASVLWVSGVLSCRGWVMGALGGDFIEGVAGESETDAWAMSQAILGTVTEEAAVVAVVVVKVLGGESKSGVSGVPELAVPEDWTVDGVSSSWIVAAAGGVICVTIGAAVVVTGGLTWGVAGTARKGVAGVAGVEGGGATAAVEAAEAARLSECGVVANLRLRALGVKVVAVAKLMELRAEREARGPREERPRDSRAKVEAGRELRAKPTVRHGANAGSECGERMRGAKRAVKRVASVLCCVIRW